MSFIIVLTNGHCLDLNAAQGKVHWQLLMGLSLQLVGFTTVRLVVTCIPCVITNGSNDSLICKLDAQNQQHCVFKNLNC